MKFCVLPGQPEVYLANTAGHSCIIGETPREIPEFFEREAKAAGCFTEEEIEALRGKLIAKPAIAPERKEALKTAIIAMLNEGGLEVVTTQGLPRLDVLATRSGIADVKGEERDLILAEIKK